MTNQPVKLLKTTRYNIEDCCYFGSYYLADENKIIKSEGYSPNTLVFLRSLFKPIQASILCDCNIIFDLNIKQNELALFCASHSGSPRHIALLKKIIKKHNIKISDFEIMPQYPLDMKGFSGHKTKLHNNCSGKHLMMILMSKYLNFDIKNYLNENHPIQKLIYEKQVQLSGYKSDILTYDGCSTPLWALPIENVIKMYFNFFSKYKILTDSILNNPYIFGGHNRLDTEIIQLSNKKLFSKVGAGGFVLVYNIKLKQILLLKMTQNNNEARRLLLINMLNKLKWLNAKIPEFEFNQKKQNVAKYCFEFTF